MIEIMVSNSLTLIKGRSMKTITIGWVFIHPNGKVNTDHLHHADFNKEH